MCKKCPNVDGCFSLRKLPKLTSLHFLWRLWPTFFAKLFSAIILNVHIAKLIWQFLLNHFGFKLPYIPFWKNHKLDIFFLGLPTIFLPDIKNRNWVGCCKKRRRTCTINSGILLQSWCNETKQNFHIFPNILFILYFVGQQLQ